LPPLWPSASRLTNMASEFTAAIGTSHTNNLS
jgi:hypothetical protein